MDLTCVTIDCRDPQKVATFWNEALRWGGVTEAADGNTATCHPLEGGVYLEFVRVPEDKIVKNRLHLGCAAGALDHLGHEMERLLDLGATIAWEEEFPAHVATRYRNVVLRDPEGNEFCLGAGTFTTSQHLASDVAPDDRGGDAVAYDAFHDGIEGGDEPGL